MAPRHRLHVHVSAALGMVLGLGLALSACSPASKPERTPGASFPSPLSASLPAAPLPDWSVLIYAAIDNDAETDGNFFEFLDGVRAGWADDPRVEILLCADRSADYSTNSTSLGEDFTDARLYRVRAGLSERLSGGAEFPEITTSSDYEPDSADPENARKFLAWARAQHPARHTALMLYGHADGRAMCPDEQSGHEMGLAQLTDVVPAELSVDLMALELCFMGGIEIAYQWRPENGGFSTRYLVAIPNAGPPLDWGRVFAALRAEPGLEPEAFGKLIVHEGGLGRVALGQTGPRRAEQVRHEAIACYDLARAAEVKRAVDTLAVQLASGDGSTNRDLFLREVRGQPDDLVLDYAQGQLDVDPFVDLHDLAARATEVESLSPEVRAAAQAVTSATANLVIASWGGDALPRFLPGASGVYISFPGNEATWRRYRWYTPDPIDGVYGRLAWCRDGATRSDGQVQTWHELLDLWLDEATPEGGVNGYRY